MSTDPRPGMIRFNGLPTVWWMAICQTCDTAMPFTSEVLRNAWMAEHVQTRNCVITTAVDLVPDPAATAEKKKALIDRLRQKYSRPLGVGQQVGNCASAKCRQRIAPAQRAINREGLWYHAGCLPDEQYIAMASASDVAPLLARPDLGSTLADFRLANPSLRRPPAPPGAEDSVQVRIIGGEFAGHVGIRAGGGGGGGGGIARTVTVPRSSLISFDTDPAGKLGHTLKLAEESIAALFGVPTELVVGNKPRKPNARDRRRAKRAGKQWK